MPGYSGMAGPVGGGGGGRSASSSAPGGGGGNNEQPQEDGNGPVESPIPAHIEADVREEARRLCDELVQSGVVRPVDAKLLTRIRVCAFVRSFEPDQPPQPPPRLDHQNPYMGSGPFSAWWRPPPGRGRGRWRGGGMAASGGGGGGMPAPPPPTTDKATSGPLTRAQCKAVDNIMGDTRQSRIFEIFGGERGAGPGPGTANPPGLSSALGGGGRVRRKRGSGAFAKGMRPHRDMPNGGFGPGMGILR
jgi:hypothetical protein